jgi:hypothetical protein
MEEKLYQKLKRDCRLILLCTMILTGVFLLWFLSSLLTYLGVMTLVEMKDEMEMLSLLAPTVLLIGAIVAASVKSFPYGKDLRMIRKHEYRIIEATFLRYDYQRVNADSSRMYAVPLFCDTLAKEILTFSVDKELEQDVSYRIGYLPNTKTATIEKL